MKTKLFFLQLSGLLMLISTSIHAQYSWKQKANFGGGNRGECAGFSTQTTGYILTGYDGSYYTEVWAWNPVSNVWSKKANFPGVGKRAASAVSCGGYGFLIGGQSSSGFTNDIWEYYPSTDSWSKKTNFPGSARYRAFAVADTVNKKIYYGCGDDGASNYLSDFWVYDIGTDTWTQKTSFPGGQRAGECGFFLNGYIYWGTGNGNDGVYEATHDWWKYDPTSDTWTQVTGLPRNAERRHATTFTFSGQGYVALGDSSSPSGSGFLTDLWMYDPGTDTWTQEANYGGVGAAVPVGFSIGVSGYVGTGITSSSYTNEFWEYSNPSSTKELATNSTLNISVYPEPANNYLTLSLNNIEYKQAYYSIYNSLGQSVKQTDIIQSSYTQINTTNLPNGLYYIRIVIDGNYTTKKFTIIR